MIYAIFCADLHLRSTVPECRNDDYQAAQWKKVTWLRHLQELHECDVLCAGDVFDTWHSPLSLVLRAVQALPQNFYFVAGQHELPYHRFDRWTDGPLGFLDWSVGRQLVQGISGPNFPIWGSSYGQDLPTREQSREVSVVLAHRMFWSKDKPYPSAPDEGSAERFLSQRPDIHTIVTGDNHQPFVIRNGKQLFVNCGSMTRMSVDQADYKPGVWLWDGEDVTFEPYPIEEDVVDTVRHIERKERDERVADFVEKLGNTEVTLNFAENLRRKLDLSDLPKRVKDMVWRCFDE